MRRFATRLAAVSLATLAVALHPVREARAQRAPSAARDAFERGVSALEAQRYVDALASFEESYRLRPSPIALYNIAVSLRGLGRIRDATATFERYLAAPERGLDRGRLQSIRAEIDELRRQVVTLRLTAQPRDATLLVDGRPLQPSQAPGPAVEPGSVSAELDPGRHVIEVSAEGYRTSRREVELRSGATVVLDVTLESLGLGRLVVTPSVPDALVRVDGRVWGVGPVDRLIAPGEHEVEVRAPRCDPFRRSVRITGESAVRIDARLASEGSATRAWLVPTIASAGAVTVAAGVLTALYLTASPAPRPVSWGTFDLAPR
jgi:hypothetical protein